MSLIHGLTAGGGVDVSARLIAEGLSRGSASRSWSSRTQAPLHIIAAKIAAPRPTAIALGWMSAESRRRPRPTRALPYNPLEDFTFIGQAVEFPFVI